MSSMRRIRRSLVSVGEVLLSLVRDDAYTDIRATYPEHAKATQEQSATNASVTTSLSGLGHSGVG